MDEQRDMLHNYKIKEENESGVRKAIKSKAAGKEQNATTHVALTCPRDQGIETEHQVSQSTETSASYKVRKSATKKKNMPDNNEDKVVEDVVKKKRNMLSLADKHNINFLTVGGSISHHPSTIHDASLVGGATQTLKMDALSPHSILDQNQTMAKSANSVNTPESLATAEVPYQYLSTAPTNSKSSPLQKQQQQQLASQSSTTASEGAYDVQCYSGEIKEPTSDTDNRTPKYGNNNSYAAAIRQGAANLSLSESLKEGSLKSSFECSSIQGSQESLKPDNLPQDHTPCHSWAFNDDQSTIDELTHISTGGSPQTNRQSVSDTLKPGGNPVISVIPTSNSDILLEPSSKEKETPSISVRRCSTHEHLKANRQQSQPVPRINKCMDSARDFNKTLF